MLPDRIIQRSGGIWERDVVDGWVQVLADVSNLANFIAETDFVPPALRTRPAAVAACILTGRELGIGPMQSLKSIHMVQGVPSLSAEYKRARALAAGHDIVFDETNSTRCIVRGRRGGTDRWVTITWHIDMAKRAKLAGKDVWQQYPQRMLQARASSELCDLLFPDASLGLATSEVLEDGGIVTDSGETVDATSGEVTSGTTPAAIEQPKPRTAQRKARSDSPTGAAAAAGSAQAPQSPQTRAPAPEATAPSGDLPPLPGEDGPPPPEPDHDSPGTVTGPQLTRIWATLTGEFGFPNSDKDAARQACAGIIGRDLASSKDMSHREAGVVIDTLASHAETARRRGISPRDLLSPASRGPDGGDPRDDVLASLARLGITGAEAIADTLTQLSGQSLSSVESLTRKQAAWVAERLGRLASRADLDALLQAGEVPGE
jgi:hypothetical protein